VRDFSNARVQFATNAPVQDTPFAKTLKYFKQFKDKENTPSKSRRNASLPEEIAELAKDAQQEGIEDNKEMWDEYRKIDLAPMDPIMGDQIAGDLIMGTPVRKTVSVVAENPKSFDRSRVITIRPKARGLPGDDKNNDQTSASLSLNAKVIEGYDNETGPAYIVDIPGHFNDAFQLRFRTRASVELIASFLRERGDALDASEADIDSLVEVRLEIHASSSPLTYLCRNFLSFPTNSPSGALPTRCRPALTRTAICIPATIHRLLEQSLRVATKRTMNMIQAVMRTKSKSYSIKKTPFRRSLD
jgi:hypothetical protein